MLRKNKREEERFIRNLNKVNSQEDFLNRSEDNK